MKKIIFRIIVVLLSPVYFSIKLCEKAVELVTELVQPFSEGLQDIVENMVDFWKKIFKIKED